MRKLLLPVLLLALLCGCDDLRGLAKDVQLADLRDKIDAGIAKADEDLKESDWREGERELAEAIADPRFTELSKDERASAWRQRGVLMGYLGEHRKARRWKLVALKLKPVWPKGWQSLAREQLKLDDFEGAARSLVHVLEQDPKKLPDIEDNLFEVIYGTKVG